MAAFLGIPAYKLGWGGAAALAAGSEIAVVDNIRKYVQWQKDTERLEKAKVLEAHAAQMYANPDKANLAQMQQQLVAEQNLAANTDMQVPGESFNAWRNRFRDNTLRNLEITAEQGNDMDSAVNPLFFQR